MKQIISIVIIVAALAAAGVFGYYTFFNSIGTDTAPLTTAQTGGSEILPLGSKLDFENVQKFNKDQRIYQYPVVNQSEVGAIMGSMIKQ